MYLLIRRVIIYKYANKLIIKKNLNTNIIIIKLPYLNIIKHPFFTRNSGQSHHNVGQNNYNSGKGCLFSGVLNISQIW